MNRDLTVLTVLLLTLFLEGVGAWHFVPLMAGGSGWAASDSVVLAVSMLVTSAALVYFSVLVVKRIASRIY